ncbi:MAG: hypothetical protein H0X51_01535 [Parachlamydiaceae bacterium]|nr:hypothetical protein [Parachlamydiaceae bacterium]
MMGFCNKKNNIVLSDYNYQRDIENRVLMADFSLFDLDVLQEVLDDSLTIPVKQLAESLKVSAQKLKPAIEKFKRSKLIRFDNDILHVDKEMRKYYEQQILKFDEDFEPGLDFIQGLLSKVPMHELIKWYSISNSADNIFASIIDNCLRTPKIYESYLQELKFEDPIMRAIMDEVFAAPDFQIPAQTLIKKYKLAREHFEECMLHLEYNFVCCLGYQRREENWEEMVTPIHEWHTYLRFKRNTMPQVIGPKETVLRTYAEDFGFMQDLVKLLEEIQEKSVLLAKSTPYTQQLIKELVDLELIVVDKQKANALPEACEWMLQPLQEQALTIYKHASARLEKQTNGVYSERDMREIERSLKVLEAKKWYYLDDFLRSLTVPIGKHEPIALQNKGKKWRYAIPDYSPEDHAFVDTVFAQPLLESGIVATGTCNNRTCFMITAFGKMIIG